jgi:hypothetical protein
MIATNTSDNVHSGLTIRDLVTADRRVMIVGAGVGGTGIADEVADLMSRAPTPHDQILWVADNWASAASYGSGGMHLPFISEDPLTPERAARSYESGWKILGRHGLTDHLRKMPIVMLSREGDVHVPPGVTGSITDVSPESVGARPGLYRSAKMFDTKVISSCKVMPALQRSLLALPPVRKVVRRFASLAEIVALAKANGISTVVVAPGAEAGNLLGHEEVDGDLGVLLRVPFSAVPSGYHDLVIMDEERPFDLRYSIPHYICRELNIGGTTGMLYHHEELRTDDWLRHAIADDIRNRFVDSFPAFRGALRDGEFGTWWGYRPVSEHTILRWLPAEATDGVAVMEIGGFGGSGYTILPAVIEDAMRLELDSVPTL